MYRNHKNIFMVFCGWNIKCNGGCFSHSFCAWCGGGYLKKFKFFINSSKLCAFVFVRWLYSCIPVCCKES